MLDQIIPIVREAGEIVRRADHIGAHTREKTAACDLVTDYDLAVEAFLRERLLALLPEAVFFGEEEALTRDPSRGWAFIVDPIDGTTNFTRSLRQSAVSVALAREGRVECAAVYDPAKDELFSARRGGGAFLNGRPIAVSDRDLAHGLVLAGTSLYCREAWTDATFRTLRFLFDRSMDFRRLGAAALDLCYVACGRGEVFFEYRLSPWDYAAGSLIVEEAGGFAADMAGSPLPVTAPSGVWASNARCRPVLAELVKFG